MIPKSFLFSLYLYKNVIFCIFFLISQMFLLTKCCLHSLQDDVRREDAGGVNVAFSCPSLRLGVTLCSYFVVFYCAMLIVMTVVWGSNSLEVFLFGRAPPHGGDWIILCKLYSRLLTTISVPEDAASTLRVCSHLKSPAKSAINVCQNSRQKCGFCRETDADFFSVINPRQNAHFCSRFCSRF